MKSKRSLFFFITSIIFLFVSCSNKPIYPITKKVPQVDSFYKVKIEDPYRWLEDFNSEEVKAWVNSQNKLTKRYVSRNKYRKEIRNNLETIWTGDSKSLSLIHI